ncbi:unnamed protein product, partial [Rotaria sp. Silwood2]
MLQITIRYKSQAHLNVECIQQEEELENSSTPFILTPLGTKHFRRQLSEQNF